MLPNILLFASALGQQLPPFTIAPGVVMPAVNVGHPDSGCEHGVGPGCAAAAYNETLLWLSIGGQGIDTAFGYQNQPEVGAAVKDAIKRGLGNRSSIFVTTKIKPSQCTAAAALAAVKVNVRQLGLDHVDLVLQHFPCDSNAGNQAVWTGLAQAKQAGLARAIGVSHYTQTDLEGLLELNTETPAVNQCEMYVGYHDDATIAFCKTHSITYEAYGALRSVDFTNKGLVAIAGAHNVSGAQVALRFVSQSGVPIAVSPGLNKEYAVEDLELGGFELTAAEMATLAAIKGPHRAH